MQRAMARQAEAERERRAKVITAEGEFQASERLQGRRARDGEEPIALQLRYLQTLLEIELRALVDDRLPGCRSTCSAVPRAGAGAGERPSYASSSAATRSRGAGSSSRPPGARRPGRRAARSTSRRPRSSASARSATAARTATPPETLRSGRPVAAPTRPAGGCASSRTSIPAFGAPGGRRRTRRATSRSVAGARRRATCARSPTVARAAVAAAWQAGGGSREAGSLRARARQRGRRRRREPRPLALAARLAERGAAARRAGAGRQAGRQLRRLRARPGARAPHPVVEERDGIVLALPVGRPPALRARRRSARARARPVHEQQPRGCARACCRGHSPAARRRRAGAVERCGCTPPATGTSSPAAAQRPRRHRARRRLST